MKNENKAIWGLGDEISCTWFRKKKHHLKQCKALLPMSLQEVLFIASWFGRLVRVERRVPRLGEFTRDLGTTPNPTQTKKETAYDNRKVLDLRKQMLDLRKLANRTSKRCSIPHSIGWSICIASVVVMTFYLKGRYSVAALCLRVRLGINYLKGKTMMPGP